MDRSNWTFAIIHYAILLTLIFAVLGGIEFVGGEIPFWAGVVVAVAIGVLYPSVVRGLGVAPEHWE